jgi:hypothetical protein
MKTKHWMCILMLMAIGLVVYAHFSRHVDCQGCAQRKAKLMAFMSGG